MGRARDELAAGFREGTVRPTTGVVRCGFAVLAWVAGLGSEAVAAAPMSGSVPAVARYQGPDVPEVEFGSDDDWNGDASVTVEIGPRTSSNEISLDSSGVNDSASTNEDPGGPNWLAGMRSSDQGLAESAIERVDDASSAVLPVQVERSITDINSEAASLLPVLAGDQVQDGMTVDGIATGGQTGASVQIGDTMPGAGEPGAPGGDATVNVRVGPITGGVAISGEATGGNGIALLDNDAIETVADAGIAAGAARLGTLLSLDIVPADDGRRGPATGGDAIGGAARGGDATVDIVIGDTIGGAGVDGQAGGDAQVLIEIGPVTGGRAVGGDAAGGDAIQGTGSAQGGSAAGGSARGGDARVVIAIGDTIGIKGGGARGGAAVVIAIGSLNGGDAIGGTAIGGDAWGLAGIDATGGNAAGGDAAGGSAVVELRIDAAPGSDYQGHVNAIIGGDATGGDATGGDAIDLELAD